MLIDIKDLRLNKADNLKVDEVIELSSEQLQEAKIMETKNLEIKGSISAYGNNEYYLDLIMSGTIVLPCSVTLKPVDNEISAEITGLYSEMMAEIGENERKVENSLDIFPILWENILMEIPIKVTCPEATDLKLSGDGWKLVTEESDEKVNSAFDKLKDLL